MTESLRAAPELPGMGISAVERDTGVPKETLRVWERRYGFPAPDRDASGERSYPREQVERLRLVRRLLDAGHRPGRILRLPDAQLKALLAAGAGAAPPAEVSNTDAPIATYEALIREHRIDALRSALTGDVVRLGLARFVTELVSPLTRMVGEAWAQGALEIFEEHLYTEAIQSVLRGAIGTVPRAGGAPRVLLGTLPNETHALGLLMAEALMTHHGAACTSLGTQTPVPDIAKAARVGGVDIVALSFSGNMPTAQVEAGLRAMRDALPVEIELWAGGAGTARRQAGPGIRILVGLAEIDQELRRWRAADVARSGRPDR